MARILLWTLGTVLTSCCSIERSCNTFSKSFFWVLIFNKTLSVNESAIFYIDYLAVFFPFVWLFGVVIFTVEPDSLYWCNIPLPSVQVDLTRFKEMTSVNTSIFRLTTSWWEITSNFGICWCWFRSSTENYCVAFLYHLSFLLLQHILLIWSYCRNYVCNRTVTRYIRHKWKRDSALSVIYRTTLSAQNSARRRITGASKANGIIVWCKCQVQYHLAICNFSALVLFLGSCD